MFSSAQTVDTVVEEAGAEAPAIPLRLHSPVDEDPIVALPARPAYMMAKIAGEWLVAFMLVVGSAPLVILLALAIKITSRGPAFYAQTRFGRNGKHYRLYKLRTMVHNAEAKTGPVWAAAEDVRITPLGRILRDTHLDELPQLLNVIRGDMSLIGPRPERPEIASRIERELPAYRLRLNVRPGITGLAQMLVPADDPSDPKLRSVRRKLAHDIYYVREVSFLLDLRIACSTSCYFVASAIDSIRRSVMRSSSLKVKTEMTAILPPPEDQRPLMVHSSL